MIFTKKAQLLQLGFFVFYTKYMKKYIVLITLLISDCYLNSSQDPNSTLRHRTSFTVTDTRQRTADHEEKTCKTLPAHTELNTDTATDSRQLPEVDKGKKKHSPLNKKVEYRDPTCWEECQADCYQGMRDDCLKCAGCCAACEALAVVTSYYHPEPKDIYEEVARYGVPLFFCIPTIACSVCAYKCHCKATHLRSKKPIIAPHSPKMT